MVGEAAVGDGGRAAGRVGGGRGEWRPIIGLREMFIVHDARCDARICGICDIDRLGSERLGGTREVHKSTPMDVKERSWDAIWRILVTLKIELAAISVRHENLIHIGFVGAGLGSSFGDSAVTHPRENGRGKSRAGRIEGRKRRKPDYYLNFVDPHPRSGI